MPTALNGKELCRLNQDLKIRSFVASVTEEPHFHASISRTTHFLHHENLNPSTVVVAVGRISWDPFECALLPKVSGVPHPAIMCDGHLLLLITQSLSTR